MRWLLITVLAVTTFSLPAIAESPSPAIEEVRTITILEVLKKNSAADSLKKISPSDLYALLKPDLSLQVFQSPEPIAHGKILTYEFLVDYKGDEPAKDVVVRLTYAGGPATPLKYLGSTFVTTAPSGSAECTFGSLVKKPFPEVIDDGTPLPPKKVFKRLPPPKMFIKCKIGDMAQGQTALITMKFQVLAKDGTSFKSKATVSAKELDDKIKKNNTVLLVTQVGVPAIPEDEEEDDSGATETPAEGAETPPVDDTTAEQDKTADTTAAPAAPTSGATTDVTTAPAEGEGGCSLIR